MNFYSRDRAWSERFLPEVQSIVGARLLSPSPDLMDWHEATDLMMLDAKDLRVAVRIRRPGYAARFPHQFTNRSRVASGHETELSKIVNGKADWMFYGHASESGAGLGQWHLIDLRAFRAALIRQATNGPRVVCGDKRNIDGSAFKWFDMRSFPSEPSWLLHMGEQP